MRTVCSSNSCTGCTACSNVCPQKCINITDSIYAYNAVIDENRCINCGLCKRVCPNIKRIPQEHPKSWFQGWTLSETARSRSSSGGVATALLKSFVANGGWVCSCIQNNGNFVYYITNEIEQVSKFAGSKYVKSDPSSTFSKIKVLLKNNNKVLFLGLPCHVAGLLNFVGEDLRKNLYTVDLICHGSPSPEIIKKYLLEHNQNPRSSISFRKGNKFRVWVNDTPIVPYGIEDRYMLAFLKGLCYTENCYSCRYAGIKRISDITLGDSWGSMLSIDEKNKGISLILCQTDRGERVLKASSIKYMPVDLQIAIQNNGQLQKAYTMPNNRSLFFRLLENHNSVDATVFRCFPKICLRQDIKSILIKLKLYKAH